MYNDVSEGKTQLKTTEEMNLTIKPFGFSLQVKFLDYLPVTSED